MDSLETDVVLTEHLLDECDLVENLASSLGALTPVPSKANHVHPVALTHQQNGKSKDAVPEREKEKEQQQPILPQAFVGHAIAISKMIAQASQKSLPIRKIIASCSGYPTSTLSCILKEYRQLADTRGVTT